jgi:hypothetical protein
MVQSLLNPSEKHGNLRFVQETVVNHIELARTISFPRMFLPFLECIKTFLAGPWLLFCAPLTGL